MATAIAWTDETWNPVTGCTRVSPGCANCYIERTPPFRMSGRVFARVGNEETTGVQLHPDRLEKPLRWRKPRRVFVCSLADLFHEQIDYHYVRDVFNVMRRCDGGIVAATGKADPSHTFQVLTKRPERVLELWRDRKLGFTDWPANVWLGVSIENARYTWRADVLREIPAAVRFVSAEPLLGSLVRDRDGSHFSAAVQEEGDYRGPLDLSGIDWLIAGGESGPGARPMHPDWVRELRDACLGVVPSEGGLQFNPGPLDVVEHRTGVASLQGRSRPDRLRAWLALGGSEVDFDLEHPRPAFFFKQWGEWAPFEATGDQTDRDLALDVDGASRAASIALPGPDTAWMRKLGKKRAGRLLDGREWNEYPEARRG